MNKEQKEVQQQFLRNEKETLEALKSNYKDALDEINNRIAILLGREDADMQHVIYQVNYQNQLKDQIGEILEKLQVNNFESVQAYLEKAYEDGFIGTLYDLQAQGIPLIFPIDQRQVVEAIRHDTKLSTTLYKSFDMKDLKTKIAGEISRGISNGEMVNNIAKNISGYTGISQNKAMRIARTESHRIQIKATRDVQHKAKEKGADIVKQWDSTLDAFTRDSHRKLDGQIRELDEDFEVDGMTAEAPGMFGDPSEDINCRCALLQRARWALGNDYTKWSADAPVLIDDDGTTQYVNVEAKDYQSFKEQYNDITERVRSDVQKIKALENDGKSSKIELEDTIIHKSVGAKFKNYDVVDPSSGDIFHFAEGTKIQNSEVFAGKGTKKSLHEGVAEGLSKQYGGETEKWQHCKGNGVLDYFGEERKAEVHWFQEETVGKVKFKVKEWKDEN